MNTMPTVKVWWGKYDFDLSYTAYKYQIVLDSDKNLSQISAMTILLERNTPAFVTIER